MDDHYANELLKKAVLSGDVEIDKDSLDIANTNAFFQDQESSAIVLSDTRYVSERKTLISINSSNREIYDYTIYPRNKLGFYVRETGGLPETITPALLNSEEPLSNPILNPYYYLANGDIAQRVYKYEDPSRYTLQLPKTYTNVKSIRLLSVEMPECDCIFNINETNNIILLDLMKDGINVIFGSGIYYIEYAIPVGFYASVQALFDVICADISAIISLDFIYDYNFFSGIIKLSIANPDYSFHLKFKYNTLENTKYSLWKMLGFRSSYEMDSAGNDKFTVLLTNSINGQRPYNFPNLFPDTYYYMILNDYTNIEEADNKGINITTKYFSKINNNYNYNYNYNNNNSQKFTSSPMIFTNTIDKLSSISVKFVTTQGEYVNFNGRDHSFTIEIIEYIDELDNVKMNTRRGLVDKKWYPDIIKSN